ncbi:DUF418 domain-containing protein [Sanyastnella coralliicola]|uniref:DUF418 domain-containing protein n=1 Tax=Sanyastnella coralliicola TaxID=3069118 RepID=UPI0027BB132E|nr:DUF418 domain-containing protein [Longitalea sp. SCSIO 12813]
MRQARITGIDLSFAFVLPLIMYYGYHLEIGQNRDFFLRDQFHLFYDGAVAMFLFLIGFATGIAGATYQGIKQVQKYVALRGFFFIALGLIMSLIWPTNLFVLLGIGSILLAVLLPLHTTFLYFLAAMIAIAAAVFNLFTEYPTNLVPWQELPVGTIKHYVRDGYYGVMPWLFFMIVGTIYSRTDFLRASRRNFKIVLGFVLVLVAFAFEFVFERMLSTGAISDYNPFTKITALHLLIPSFLIGGTGLCVMIFNIALQVSDRFLENPLFITLRRFGRMKYSVLVFQAIGGICAGLLLSGLETFGAQTVIILGILISVGSILFAALWLKRFDAGPVELLLNALSGRK